MPFYECVRVGKCLCLMCRRAPCVMVWWMTSIALLLFGFFMIVSWMSGAAHSSLLVVGLVSEGAALTLACCNVCVCGSDEVFDERDLGPLLPTPQAAPPPPRPPSPPPRTPPRIVDLALVKFARQAYRDARTDEL